jgi:hypothetical protein
MSIQSIVTAGRRLLSTAFLDSCVIADRIDQRDNRGGHTVTWTDRTTATECWFTQMSDDIPVVAATSETFGAAVALLLLPVDTDIVEGDRVTNQKDGGKWIVTRNITPPSAISTSVRVGIRQAQGGEAD